MSFKITYESETVKIRLLYNEEYTLEKIKFRINNGTILKGDLRTGVQFLEQQGLEIDKDARDRWSEDKLIAHLEEEVTTVEIEEGVEIRVSKPTDYGTIEVDNVKLIDEEFIEKGGINYMVDYVLALYNRYYKYYSY